MSKRNGQLKPGKLYLLEIKPDKPISREVAKLLAEELLKKQTELNVSFKSISIRAERISLQLRPVADHSGMGSASGHAGCSRFRAVRCIQAEGMRDG